MKLSKLVMTAVALTLSAGAANAQSVVSDQRNNANIRSQLNARVMDVTGDVAATAAAIGNSFTVDGASVTGVRNYQNFWGDSSSLLNGTGDHQDLDLGRRDHQHPVDQHRSHRNVERDHFERW
jgi:hypothetical protein